VIKLRSGKWGYVSPSGAVAIAPRFEEAGFFYDGRAAVRVNGAWGPGGGVVNAM